MAPKDGTPTREKILAASETLVIARGLSGTSIDNILTAAGITKGSFFYHFKNKDELACALVERFAERDQGFLRDYVERAERLSRDPLQRLLILIGLAQEHATELATPDSGCLFASYCYQKDLVPEAALEIAAESMLLWRAQLKQMLEAAAEKYPPRMAVSFDVLADHFNAVIEGAFVMGLVMRDARALPQHIEQFRNYVELLFTEPDPPSLPAT